MDQLSHVTLDIGLVIIGVGDGGALGLLVNPGEKAGEGIGLEVIETNARASQFPDGKWQEMKDGAGGKKRRVSTEPDAR